MKITVCDVCKSEGKLTETRLYSSLKGVAGSRLDHCKECSPKIPKGGVEYLKFVYKVVSGITLNDEAATQILQASKRR